MRTIHTKIVGVTYPNADGSSRQDILASLHPGMQLRLVDAASAKYPEAIAVFTQDGRQCGHLSADLATSLREEYVGFSDFAVTVSEVTGGDGRNYGCNIEILVNEVIRTKLISVKQSEVEFLSVGDSLSLYDLSLEKGTDAIGVGESYSDPFAKLNKKTVGMLRASGADFESFDVTITSITENDNGKLEIEVEIVPSEESPVVAEEESEPVPTPQPTPDSKPAPAPKPAPSPIRTEAPSAPVPSSRPSKKASGCLGLVLMGALAVAALLLVI